MPCNSKLYDIKQAMPFLGGGVIPGMVPRIMDDIGPDCLLGVGAGIHVVSTMKNLLLLQVVRTMKHLQMKR